jgi:hypothetical protein
MFLANGTAYTPLVTNCAPLSTSSGNVNQSIQHQHHHQQQQQQQQHTNSQDFRENPQQALADSVSAITTHPDFTAALAAAITSIFSQNNTQSAHIHAAAQQLQQQAREGGVVKETTTSQSSAFTVVTPVNGGATQRERVERQSPPRVGGAPAPVPVTETTISSILNSALMSITNDQKPGIKSSSAASHLVATTTERAQR